ncbi:YgfZ/GcvT domain-containing protein, partial [Paracoccus sanguinis]|uniref:CAF17-like 4Fe-4S cluster assembly/insertion protein YgfZ n=1 Tax=Paracoccus sanguinis TaxID=1545044 RepID=UPI0012E09A34
MRTILRVTGPDREHFLQGLVTNDVRRAPVWAALLTPQGKYLADFFVVPDGESLLIDVDARLADDLLRRLSMYKLRSQVEIATTPLTVTRGTGPAPEGAIADPRHPALGWRLYADAPAGEDATDWDALRVAHLVPESLAELVPNESYPLEAGFERLHGVDFRKGCYVGQEVTARMKHKTELRKGLTRVRIEGEAAPGTPILTEDGREAGTLGTVAGTHALAHLRFDRAPAGSTLAAGARSKRRWASAWVP